MNGGRETERTNLIVGFLLGCKTSSVDAIVDAVVSPAVHLIYAALKMSREEIHFWVFCKVVEFAVEDLRDFRALVVHDGLVFLVPQHLISSCRAREAQLRSNGITAGTKFTIPCNDQCCIENPTLGQGMRAHCPTGVRDTMHTPKVEWRGIKRKRALHSRHQNCSTKLFCIHDITKKPSTETDPYTPYTTANNKVTPIIPRVEFGKGNHLVSITAQLKKRRRKITSMPHSTLKHMRHGTEKDERI